MNDRGELVARHAVHRVGVPRLHERAELALPAREGFPAGGIRGAELPELVEGALGVGGVRAEEGDVDRRCAREDERAHRGRMELQVDLCRRRAVGAADDVELPVAERRAHRVEVVHRHPRPVLRHVAAAGVRSAGAALVDEQDVAFHVQPRQLLAQIGGLLGSGPSGPAGEIRDRVLPDGVRERREDDDAEPDRAPVRFRAVLRDDEGAAAGFDPLHRARARRPRLLRPSRERSLDADADAGGGHQADEQPHNPLRQSQCSVRGGRLA